MAVLQVLEPLEEKATADEFLALSQEIGQRNENLIASNLGQYSIHYGVAVTGVVGKVRSDQYMWIEITNTFPQEIRREPKALTPFPPNFLICAAAPIPAEKVSLDVTT